MHDPDPLDGPEEAAAAGREAAELPPEVPQASTVSIPDLLARLGSKDLELESARERETALREQNAFFRQRLIDGGLAKEPEGSEDALGLPAEENGPTTGREQ